MYEVRNVPRGGGTYFSGLGLADTVSTVVRLRSRSPALPLLPTVLVLEFDALDIVDLALAACFPLLLEREAFESDLQLEQEEEEIDLDERFADPLDDVESRRRLFTLPFERFLTARFSIPVPAPSAPSTTISESVKIRDTLPLIATRSEPSAVKAARARACRSEERVDDGSCMENTLRKYSVKIFSQKLISECQLYRAAKGSREQLHEKRNRQSTRAYGWRRSADHRQLRKTIANYH